MSDSTLPVFMHGGNFDAIPWSQAAPGDYIALADPNARAQGQVFRIEGNVNRNVEQSNRFSCPCAPVQDWQGDVLTARPTQLRSFAEDVWQVWRNFNAPPAQATFDTEQFHQGVQTLIERLEAEARDRQWCSEWSEFKDDINRTVGFALFPEVPRRSLTMGMTCDVGILTDAEVDNLRLTMRNFVEDAVRRAARARGHEATSIVVTVNHHLTDN